MRGRSERVAGGRWFCCVMTVMTGQKGNAGKVRKGSWWQVVLLCDDSDDRSEGKCGEGQKG